MVYGRIIFSPIKFRSCIIWTMEVKISSAYIRIDVLASCLCRRSIELLNRVMVFLHV